MTDSRYPVRRNPESGKGRYDFQMTVKTLSGIMTAPKSAGKDNRADLKPPARSALSRIAEKRRETDIVPQQITAICRDGAAFRGRDAEGAMDRQSYQTVLS